jgi:hypothetical protein
MLNATTRRYEDVGAFADNKGEWGDKHALDTIPQSSIFVKDFHKDALKLPSEFCFIYPGRCCSLSTTMAKRLGIANPDSRKKIWFLAVPRCVYKPASWSGNEEDNKCRETYRTSISVFPSKEVAIVNSVLLGTVSPQIFEDYSSLPKYAYKLIRAFVEGVGGCPLYPAEVYRLMVLDGVVKPIKKFMKKDKKVAKAKKS